MVCCTAVQFHSGFTVTLAGLKNNVPYTGEPGLALKDVLVLCEFLGRGVPLGLRNPTAIPDRVQPRFAALF